MTWFGWLLVIIWALNALVTVGKVGDEREPITRKSAVIAVATCAVLIIGVLTVGVNS